MPKTGLTENQILLMEFINEFQSKHGTRPTFEDMSAGLNMDKTGLNTRLLALERRKFIIVGDMYKINF